MFPFDVLHELANVIVARVLVDAHWWVQAVTHIAVMYGPAALALLFVIKSYSLWTRYAREQPNHRPCDDCGRQVATSLSPGLFRYIRKRTWRHQIALIAIAGLSMPVLYASLELPKLIINNVLDGGSASMSMAGNALEPVTFLFVLCAMFFTAVLTQGVIKYAANLYQGRLSEDVIRRLRLTAYREWRRRGRPGGGAGLIPVMVQELEPIGGFTGEAFVVPVLQGGTFLTILTFMLIQDPILGAAAVTLLPVQLVLIPRLQRKISALARQRVREVRHLADTLGREPARGGESMHDVFASLRRIQVIRVTLFRKKHFMKALNNFIGHMTPFFFYTIGGYLVINGQLSFGALVAVLTAYKDFSAPLKELFRYYQTMEDVRVRYEEVRRYLTHEVFTAPPVVIETQSQGAFRRSTVGSVAA